MTVLRDLADVDLHDRAEVGSKAAVLGALLRRGLPVPPGFVVVDARRFGGPSPIPVEEGLIARSSATVEDGGSASFAGQFESVGAVKTRAALLDAVGRVSRPGRRAAAYASRLGIALPKRIPVLVQRQVEVASAGVLFTVDPLAQRPACFALAWGDRAEVTDGGEGRFCTFDPLASDAAAIADPRVRRALPELVEDAFAILAVLSREQPLDIEWAVDATGELWILQARPVTQRTPCGREEVEQLLSEGWLLVSPRPASRLAQHHYRVAEGVDRLAAAFHHAHFERRVVDGWLLARRTKRARRQEIAASSALRFAWQFFRHRRGNLAFASGSFLAWSAVRRLTAHFASRTFRTDLRSLDDRRLRRLLAQALRSYDRVRGVHAALWYPVDLARDLDSFERQFGSCGRQLPPPSLRTRRDRDAGGLLSRIRLEHAGLHPSWEELSPQQRRCVLRHLARSPYAFARSAEVQDLAAWTSWVERPDLWWSQQAAATDVELDLRAPTPRPASPRTQTGAAARLVGTALFQTASLFAPIKDDRVELLAVAAAALRIVLLELERRAGSREADRGWIFELEPHELLAHEMPALKPLAIARLRSRVLEGFREPSQSPAPARAASDGELVGLPLAGGFASGRVCVARTAEEARQRLLPGEVLVTEEIRPAFTAVLPRACALVCRRGTPLSHAAIVARELSIPAVSYEEVSRIQDGAELWVDGDRGRLRLMSVPGANIGTGSR